MSPNSPPSLPPGGRPPEPRRLRASLGPRPAAPSMRPRPASATLEELQIQRSAHSQAQVEAQDQTLYTLLEVDPNINDEGLKRAYRALLTRYHPDSLATYGLYTRAQASALTDQVEEAYLRLSNPLTRREYNAEVFPSGLPTQRGEVRPQVNFSARFTPLIPPEAAARASLEPLSGLTLKRLRVSNEVTLEALHERTKINAQMLARIEDEDLDALPAEVYLKGFLRQIASAYGLDERALIDGYLSLYRARGAGR